MGSARGVFFNLSSITNAFSLCDLRESRNFSKEKSFSLQIPGHGYVLNQWFSLSLCIILFPGKGTYGKDDFRTVFMSVVIPGWRFLDELEQLNHVSQLCLTAVEQGDAPQPGVIGEPRALIRPRLSPGRAGLLVRVLYVSGLSVNCCWAFLARNISVRYPGLPAVRVAQSEYILTE